MPTNDYTGAGTYTWTVPFAVNSFTGTVIGGGASGFRDCDGDNKGGGGGGGGVARSSTTVNSGNTVTIGVGSGGGNPSCDTSNRGGRTYISGGGITIEGFGGEKGTDDQGGGGGGTGVGSYTNAGGSGQDDDGGRRGGGAGGCGRSGPSDRGGKGQTLSLGCTGDAGGRNGAAYGGGGAGNDGGDAGSGAGGAARIEFSYALPGLTNITATPNPQNSDAGTPLYTSNIVGTASNASSVTITGNGQSYTPFSGNTTTPRDFNRTVTLPQSTAGSNSPASATFTITATGPGGSVSVPLIIQARNDNDPNVLTAPTQTTSGRALTGLEPNQAYVVSYGTVSGIDMPTLVSATSNCRVSTTGSGAGSNTLFITVGQTLFVHFTSRPFNTDPSGLTNTGSLSFTIGPDSYSLNFTTRAPVVKEIFDFEGPKNALPNPDIDTLPSPSPKSFIQTGDDNSAGPIDVTCNDIEISVEIKVGNSNAQVQINQDGVWRNMRSI